ncbi:unnamed protein product [Laminaria digitata]
MLPKIEKIVTVWRSHIDSTSMLEFCITQQNCVTALSRQNGERISKNGRTALMSGGFQGELLYCSSAASAPLSGLGHSDNNIFTTSWVTSSRIYPHLTRTAL